MLAASSENVFKCILQMTHYYTRRTVIHPTDRDAANHRGVPCHRGHSLGGKMCPKKVSMSEEIKSCNVENK